MWFRIISWRNCFAHSTSHLGAADGRGGSGHVGVGFAAAASVAVEDDEDDVVDEATGDAMETEGPPPVPLALLLLCFFRMDLCGADADSAGIGGGCGDSVDSSPSSSLQSSSSLTGPAAPGPSLCHPYSCRSDEFSLERVRLLGSARSLSSASATGDRGLDTLGRPIVEYLTTLLLSGRWEGGGGMAAETVDDDMEGLCTVLLLAGDSLDALLRRMP